MMRMHRWRAASVAAMFAAAVIATPMIVATQVAAQNAGSQVVAKIGADPITRADVQRELPPGAMGNPAAERAALQGLIDRRLLVAEAKKQGLDRTPLGAMVLKRADEMALVGVLQQDFAGKPPEISDAQAGAFVSSHPTMFANRRLISLDQFIVDDNSPQLVNALKPANSMSDFEEILARNRASYHRAGKVIDTLSIRPEVAAKLAGFAPGVVFITPSNNTIELSDVTENRVAPIDGPAAQRMARLFLGREQMFGRVNQASAAIVKAGQDKVKVNPQFDDAKKKK